nr:hypothetical protein [uncultured Dyadobacter sp.]
MKTKLFTLVLLILGSFSIANAQDHLYGRWKNETVNNSGTVTTYIYEFRSDNHVIFERAIRSDKRKFTSNIVVEGSWSQTAFTPEQCRELAQQDAILREYYLDDQLSSLRKVSMQLNKVISCVAKNDDGTILAGEQNSLVEIFKDVSLSEYIPKQYNSGQMVVLTFVKDHMEKMIYERVR